MKQEQKSIATLLQEHFYKVGETEFKKEWEEVEKQCEGMPNAPMQALFLPCVSQRSELLKAFYAYIDDKWALGMLTNKVDEVIEGFEKSL